MMIYLLYKLWVQVNAGSRRSSSKKKKKKKEEEKRRLIEKIRYFVPRVPGFFNLVSCAQQSNARRVRSSRHEFQCKANYSADDCRILHGRSKTRPERHSNPHIGQERHASPHIRHMLLVPYMWASRTFLPKTQCRFM